VRAYAANTN